MLYIPIESDGIQKTTNFPNFFQQETSVSGDTSQSFFKVFYEKMNEAQLEIKATVTVNTTDIAAKANEDKDQSGKELEKAQRKRNAKLSNGVSWSQSFPWPSPIESSVLSDWNFLVKE